MKPTAYEGNEKYIFISYAHKDKDAVFEVLRELEADGYRFWYDDGIAPGSEWPEDIAMHLSNAEAVIAFITPNAVASSNCRREINFSLSKNKPFLSVLIERTEMSPGLEMQLSAQQSVIRYNYDTWEGFIRKIKMCPAIKPCRREPEDRMPHAAAPAQAPAVSAPATPAPAVPTPAPAVSASVAAPVAVERKAKREKKVREKPVKAAASDAPAPKKKSGALKIIGGVLLAAVLLIVLLFSQSNKKITMSWGDEVSAKVQSFSVREQTVTQDDLTKIAQSKELYAMQFEDCDLSGCDFGALNYKSDKVHKLEFVNCTGISDYSFLSGMNLKQLSVVGDPSFRDLGVLNAAPIETLNVSGTGVADLSPLDAAENIQNVNISGTAVSDLSALNDKKSLKILNASSTKVDLADVAGFPGLTELNLSGCDLSGDASQVTALSLSKLYLADCNRTDFSTFSDCTVLTELDVSGNDGMTDLDWLNAQNYSSLKVVNLAGTGLDADDVSFLSKCTALKRLNIRGIPLDDLSFCAGHADLEWIAADGCGISDLSGLKDCTKLKTVLLSFNKISDISALSAVEPSVDVVIDLSFNEVSDLSPLKAGKYRAVMLCGNDPDVIASLPDGVGGWQVFCDWYEGIEQGALVTSKERFTEVYIVGVPADQQLNVENGIGKTRLHLVTYGEMYDILVKDDLAYPLREDFSYQAAMYNKTA
ncbi:MAG: TIR domain-containing protein [Mogibacterium sp.]|nr:TIR domain-containing protein [Mogibacterium sp.]